MKKSKKISRKRTEHTLGFAVLIFSCILAGIITAVVGYSRGQSLSTAHAASNRAKAQIASASGTFVTLLFSRTEITAADNCVASDSGITRLDTTVAPYLQSLGLVATGTLETGTTQDASEFCTHFGDSLGASWSDATNLAQTYGWTFVSHTATYPSHMSTLTPSQQYNETCGSAATIDAHGLPGGHGLIAYPGGQAFPFAMQTNYGANCFAWGRKYNQTGLTATAAATTSPFLQYTTAVNGGPCNIASAPCYTIPENGIFHYSSPSAIIAKINSLKRGQWFTLQAFILVTGTNPAYTTNATKWDCTASDPNLHWTNDEERYCYTDWQQIVQAIALKPNIIVTDPLTVGVAFGRPSSYSFPPPTPIPPTPTPTPLPTATPTPTPPF